MAGLIPGHYDFWAQNGIRREYWELSAGPLCARGLRILHSSPESLDRKPVRWHAANWQPSFHNARFAKGIRQIEFLICRNARGQAGAQFQARH
jgi:hypothetical protein